MYIADNWVIVLIPEGTKPFYKLVAQVGEGLNDWRINSGISSVTEDELHVYFHGPTGSTYKCAKAAEGLSRVLTNLLSSMPPVDVILYEDIVKDYLLNA